MCNRFMEGNKVPKTVTVIHIQEVLFHCVKAISRAKLWEASSRVERGRVPSPGQMKAAMSQQGADVADKIDEKYEQEMKKNLYGQD